VMLGGSATVKNQASQATNKNSSSVNSWRRSARV
jgi:hypothetical protein